MKMLMTGAAAGALFFLAAPSFAQTAAAAPQPGQDPANGQAAKDAAPTEVVITGYRKSLADARKIKRDSTIEKDAIVAEDMAKFPELNLAESLQRLPGVEITREAGEGREIALRGLAPISPASS